MKRSLSTTSVTKIFKRKSVLFAYQFGSTIAGNTTRESDVDIAVFFTDSLTPAQRFQKRLELMEDLERIYKKRVDVVSLNDLHSLFFKFTIIREGRVIYDSSELERAEFESRTMGLYFDFKPFLEQYNQAYVQRSLK